jgi:Cu+-exporting ATPase
MADEVAAYFVPAVMAIAVVCALLVFISGRSVSFSLNIAISVLVISCPCALGLATPLAITVGSGRTADYGILFRDAASLEMVGRADSVILDKTGTITYGKPEVTGYTGPVEILSEIGAGESRSEHPIGKAIVDYCKENGAKDVDVGNFEYVVGKGISFTCEGRRFTVGSADLYGGRNTDDEGTTAYVSMDGEPMGAFHLSDGIRKESKEVVSILQSRGVSVHMVTGDNERAAEAIAEQCGIGSVTSGALPADKVMAVKRLQASGHDVIMVGDGINDSPALAQADVGIAMGSGSNIALSTSDVVLMNDDLYNIPRAVDFGHAVLRNIKQNLFLAFCYNVICIPLAAGLPYLFGMAEFSHMPMIAAAAMSCSSLSVVTNALRLKRFRPGY